MDDEIFLEELKFFQIDDTRILSEGRDIEQAIQYIKGDHLPTPERGFQATVWELFYNPASSIPAGILELISITSLLIIVTLSCSETLPSVRADLANSGTITSRVFRIANLVCHVWFVFEYLVRFLSAADKVRYVKTWDSIIDICAVIPFFAQFFVIQDSKDIVKFFFLRTVRVIRVLRVLKITRYFREMRAIMYTLYASACDLHNFALTSGVMLVTLSSLIYHVEADAEGSTINSLPQGLWWSTNTYTTVGYGDSVPVTVPGKLVATLCMLAGFICFGLPVSCLVNNFIVFWSAMKKMDTSGDLMNKVIKNLKLLGHFKSTINREQ